jgi:osmotically inducible lipoprotein OsmB
MLTAMNDRRHCISFIVLMGGGQVRYLSLCDDLNHGGFHMLKIIKPMFALGLALGLAACGNTPGSRALSGGVLGAGAGAGISALTGGKPATGALIGGGAGAIGGAVTAP